MGFSIDTLKNIGLKALPIIGTLGTLGGSVMGLFGTNAKASMLRQYKYQRLLQQQQYDLTQQGYRESPINERIGLENAGYNPLLAVSNGMSYGNYSSGQSTAVADSADQTNAKMHVFEGITDILQGVSNIKATNASAEKMAQEAQTEVYKRENLWQDSMLKRSMEVLNNEEAPWIAKKRAAEITNLLLTGEAYKTNAETNRLNYFVNWYDAHTARHNAQTNRYLAKYGTPYRSTLSLFNKLYED